jgi:glycine/D-amino acid oxidase-like deaminating enzyme
MSFDVAVVGAGIVGAACAANLTSTGLSVVLVDRRGIASGTTAAGMGHVVVMDDSEAQFALTRYSQQLWDELASELPDLCEFEKCGTIWVAADEEEMGEVRRKNQFYASRGVSSEILDEKMLREAEPNLREGLAGGLLVSGDSVVYQLTATKFLLDKAAKQGAVLKVGKRAIGITDNSVRIENGDLVSAGKIVNAAGIGAAALSPELRITPRKGHLIITDRYPNFVRHQLVELGYLKSAHGKASDSVAFNVQPRATQQILLGSSRQFGIESSEIDYSILRRMTARAFVYMPQLRKLSAIRVWTGFRPATPDNLPYVGRLPESKNIYVAAGHEGLGITTSLATGVLVTDAILGRQSAIPIEPYLPGRKITGH